MNKYSASLEGLPNEAFRRQAAAFQEDTLRRAVKVRLGSLPPLEELAGRLHRYIAHDHRQELIALDHQPLLQVEWWPCPGSTEHVSRVLKITPMQPGSPPPFPIAEL